MSLEDSINELILREKLKFGTHKKKKAFIANLVRVFNESLPKVTPADENTSRTVRQNSVSHIIEGKKGTGATVMTPELSAKNDEMNKKAVAKQRAVNCW
jgi:hypothetical protein